MTSVLVGMRGYPLDKSGNEGQTHQPPPPASMILRSHFPSVSHLEADCGLKAMHLNESMCILKHCYVPCWRPTRELVYITVVRMDLKNEGPSVCCRGELGV